MAEEKKGLKGVSSVQAAAEGPLTCDFDSARARKCAAALLLPTEAEKDFALDQAALPEHKRLEPPVRKVFLQWTCFDRYGEEKFIRTRNIRLFHSAFKGQRSCLLVGGQVTRYKQKNNKREVVDDVINIRSVRHSNLDVQQRKIDDIVKKYPLIMCDNRYVQELPKPMRQKISVKVDCTDMGQFRKKAEWAVKSTAIKVGKGVLSVRVGSTLLTTTELLENVRFALRFLEDHIPELFANLKEASLFSPGYPALKLVNKVKALPSTLQPDEILLGSSAAAKKQQQQRQKRAREEQVPEVSLLDVAIEDRGVDIFAQRAKAAEAPAAAPPAKKRRIVVVKKKKASA
eukprot:Rhum_TRINITY_DN4743_c0_g1::Rhum_TRINITY_DN4743_c0_g1_i1::g.15495::m.15495